MESILSNEYLQKAVETYNEHFSWFRYLLWFCGLAAVFFQPLYNQPYLAVKQKEIRRG